MIPPSVWEMWMCMFNAMNLINLHPSRVEDFLPEEDEQGLIGLEGIPTLDQQARENSDTEFKKAS